jgi:hypothetical protein
VAWHSANKFMYVDAKNQLKWVNLEAILKYPNETHERTVETNVEDFCISAQSVFLLKRNDKKFTVQNLTVRTQSVGLSEDARYTTIESAGNFLLVGGIDSAGKRSRIKILRRRTLETIGQLNIDITDDPDKNAVYKFHTFLRKEILVIVILYKKWAFDIAYFDFKMSQTLVVRHVERPRPRGISNLTIDRELIGSFQGVDSVTMLGPSSQDGSVGEIISF